MGRKVLSAVVIITISFVLCIPVEAQSSGKIVSNGTIAGVIVGVVAGVASHRYRCHSLFEKANHYGMCQLGSKRDDRHRRKR